MRILVEGGGVRRRGARLALAAAGLALRGHEVLWVGGELPVFPEGRPICLHPIGALDPGLARHEAEIVLGAGGPGRAQLYGWLVRARCTVLSLDEAARARWDGGSRLLWESLSSWAVVEAWDGAALQVDPHGLDLERVAVWPGGGPPARPEAAHADTEVLERLCEYALACQRGGAPRPGVFVDRDGTLVVERGYLSDPAGLELLPGAARALGLLQGAGLPVIVVSNQAGVGRGLYPLARAYETMARLRLLLREAGVELDGIYLCPHRPEDECACRKPATGLLERAAADHRLALRQSFMVGDRRLDAETGRRAGAKGVLVRTGYGRAEEQALLAGASAHAVDHVADDLDAAARWILDAAAPLAEG